ncbi:MAG: D-alanyl-D-alanine carboxypeptidase [Firmicutes bacterium]|nr:D-alanyl-D-alanine carboxypeptidase [Bacillota bacterium]
MKRLFNLSIFFLFIFLLILFSQSLVVIAAPYVSANSACVIDLETRQVLYNKNMHLKCPPASTTKILTSIVAIEESNINDVVTVSRKAAYQEGSSIYLSEGEKIRLEELLYGVMLASGNDAAMAIADHISGSVEEYAELMNRRAVEMGAKNSNFINPSGLPDSNHYSTAYDLAMIMAYALENKIFAQITASKNKTISWSGNDWGRGLRNHNKLLWSYSDITGGKTGYTKAAGRCLVASARRDGREVVAVVLNCPNDWNDVRNLLDYGLDQFKKVVVMDKGEIVYKMNWEDSQEGELGFMINCPLLAVLPRGGKIKLQKEVYLKPSLELPIKRGDLIGSLKVYDNGELLSKMELLAANDLNYRSFFLKFWNWITVLLGGD